GRAREVEQERDRDAAAERVDDQLLHPAGGEVVDADADRPTGGVEALLRDRERRLGRAVGDEGAADAKALNRDARVAAESTGERMGQREREWSPARGRGCEAHGHLPAGVTANATAYSRCVALNRHLHAGLLSWV